MKISDVTLRTRPTKDGRLALYLHFSPAIRHPETMKLIHTEQLGIYLWEHPANVAQQQHNEDILIKAEVIRSLRVQSLINEEYGFLDHHKRNADFLEYFRHKVATSSDKNGMAYRHFERFCNGKCKFGELTLKLCERYMKYLTTQARAMKPRYECLGTNTAAAYFAVFKKVQRMAYQERMIRENLADRLGGIPKREKRRSS